MDGKKKLSIHELAKMKREGRKIAWLTAYDYPTARFAEEAGLDLLLVGDSLGMCVYGYEGTVPVTMAPITATMTTHTPRRRSVRSTSGNGPPGSAASWLRCSSPPASGSRRAGCSR